jgi:branched-chain amino acid transport system permease protein
VLRRDDRLEALARYVWEPVTLGSLLLVITAVVAAHGDKVIARTVTDSLIQGVLVIGLYIFVGNSGILAFGHLTFAMIGAYATAWLTMSPFKKSFALALPAFLADNSFPLLPSAIAAASLAAIAALITGIPLARLNGIAASIGTFAVLVIFYTLYSNWDSWTFGASTLVGVPIYVDMWVALAWVVVALFAATIHQKSRFGLALRAARENEVAARGCGINVSRQRLVAFVASAFFVGLGGVLQAHFLGSISVKTFWLGPTFIIIAMLVIGGQRSLTGAIVGAIVVSTLLELLRQLETGMPIGDTTILVPRGVRELGIALLMLVILIIRPAGLTGGREIPWLFARNASGITSLSERRLSKPASDGVAGGASGSAGKDLSQTLEARDVLVHFGGLAAVNGVTLSLRRDEVFGLIGPNGAGKTTLVNVLTGFQKPTQGTVVLGGTEVTGLEPHLLGRMGLARTFQAVRLFRDMSVIENLEVAALAAGLSRKEAALRAREILAWMHFDHGAHIRADTLPYGAERRVGIGRALAMSPRFALLDEPAAGLNDTECEDLMRLISLIPEQFRCGVLLIEHNMRVIMGVCHRIHVIDSGRTIVEGTPQEIQTNPDVISAYLGTKSNSTHA